MILKKDTREGMVRNTEKPWYIVFCIPKEGREDRWSYYRSYQTEKS